MTTPSEQPVGLPEGFVQWAHQGGAKEWPCNTVHAMEKSGEDGAAPGRALEFDVHRGWTWKVSEPGSGLVVIHDRTVTRTTERSGLVWTKTVGELQRLNAGYWFDPESHSDTTRDSDPDAYVYRSCATPPQIPTIEEVLGRFDCPMTIEIKSIRAAGPLVKVLMEWPNADGPPDPLHPPGRPNVTVVAFWDPFLWLVRLHRWWRYRDRMLDLAPGTGYLLWFRLRTALRFPPQSSRYARIQIPNRKFGIPFATTRLIEAAHRAGMKVDVWTIDDEAEMHDLIDLQVDGIMTDMPSRLAGVCRSYDDAEMIDDQAADVPAPM